MPCQKNNIYKRKIKVYSLYDSLFSLWHRLYSEGYNVNFYRLAEKRYHAFLCHSSDLNWEDYLPVYPNIRSREGLIKEIFKGRPLKEKRDLCDEKIPHVTYLGYDQQSVIAITMDRHDVLNQRMGIFKRVLIDLERDVEGWQVKQYPGEVLSLKISSGVIESAHRIQAI